MAGSMLRTKLLSLSNCRNFIGTGIRLSPAVKDVLTTINRIVPASLTIKSEIVPLTVAFVPALEPVLVPVPVPELLPAAGVEVDELVPPAAGVEVDEPVPALGVEVDEPVPPAAGVEVDEPVPVLGGGT